MEETEIKQYVADLTGLSVRSMVVAPRQRRIRGESFTAVEINRKVTANLLNKVYDALEESAKPVDHVETRTVVDYVFKTGRGRNATTLIMRTTPNEDALTIFIQV